MDSAEVTYWIGLVGTVAFASSAVLVVADRKIDLFTAIVLGVITSVGGGTLRDMILDVPVFWSVNQTYVWVAVGVSIAAFYSLEFFQHRIINRLFLYIDGLAVALFAIEAMGKVWDLGFGIPVAPVALAVVTAIGGGLARDVLVSRPTLLMSRELYAVPVLLGAIVFGMILAFAPQFRFVGSILCVGLIFGLRAATIRWGLQMPDWLIIGYRRKKPEAPPA